MKSENHTIRRSRIRAASVAGLGALTLACMAIAAPEAESQTEASEPILPVPAGCVADEFANSEAGREPGALIMTCPGGLATPEQVAGVWSLSLLAGTGMTQDLGAISDLEKLRPRPGVGLQQYTLAYWTEAPHDHLSAPYEPEPVLATGDVYVPVVLAPNGAYRPTAGAHVLLYNKGVTFGNTAGSDALSMVMAARGNVVASPHYVGFDRKLVAWLGAGDRSEVGGGLLHNGHPYMHARSGGRASMDMLAATREMCETSDHCAPTEVNLLAGSSQGGHVALSALEQLEEAAEAGDTWAEVTATAVHSGGFDAWGILEEHLDRDCRADFGPDGGRSAPDQLAMQAITSSVLALSEIYDLGDESMIFDDEYPLSHPLCPGGQTLCTMAELAGTLRLPSTDGGAQLWNEIGRTRPGMPTPAGCVELAPELSTGGLWIRKIFAPEFLAGMVVERTTERSDGECEAVLGRASNQSGVEEVALRARCAVQLNSVLPESRDSEIHLSACHGDPTIPFDVALAPYQSSETVNAVDLSSMMGSFELQAEAYDRQHAACIVAGVMITSQDLFAAAPNHPLELDHTTFSFFGIKAVSLYGWSRNAFSASDVSVDLYKVPAVADAEGNLAPNGTPRRISRDMSSSWVWRTHTGAHAYRVCIAGSFGDTLPGPDDPNGMAKLETHCSESVVVRQHGSN